MGKVALPPGKKIAVNLGVDFDAQCIWLGSFNYLTPSFMSRGQFGAEVGVPRLLDLFKRKGITTSFYIPGHTVDTFPEISKKVMDAGHEIGHHGYYHEILPAIKRDTEKRLMDLAFASYKRHFGIRPTGYRAPYWEFSESTLDLVEEAGFLYDSSMMGRDLTPYRIQRWQINWEKGNVAGPASKVLEIPVSWYLDDFPALANIGGVQEGLAIPTSCFVAGAIFSTTLTSGSTVRFTRWPCTRRSSVKPITSWRTRSSLSISCPRKEFGSPLASRLPRHGWMMRMTRERWRCRTFGVCRPLQRTHHLARNPLRPNSPCAVVSLGASQFTPSIALPMLIFDAQCRSGAAEGGYSPSRARRDGKRSNFSSQITNPR